jgi:predicted nucleic acid-binding protein
MTRYLLDTNIISNAVKPSPSPDLIGWMESQIDEDLFVSSITIAEIWRGVLEKPAGRKRTLLEEWFFGPDGPQAAFAGRILSFDDTAGLVWAKLMAEGSAAGRPRSGFDMMIAAIAETNSCIVVTDNQKDFVSIPFINPMRPG